MSDKNSAYYFLRGGGEMGELIRAKDWSSTPLGDPADWPQSLRTMVAVMLDNPFGMYIAWGSQYTQLYNDAYRPILGATKHPQALGISTKETFSEIWDNIIGAMFDDVMKGKAVGFPDLMLPLNRNGFIEECYFDFSYSPIRKDDGEVGGVLVTVIETTEKKKAQAELLESTDQLKFAMDAAELGTWDYDPATNKFTANTRLKAWFGLSASEEIALHHATDAIAEKDGDRIIMAIKKSLDYSSGGIYDEEYSIINPFTKKEIIVQGKGRAWFNDEKIAYRFNGILQEVTENVLARKKIEDSEEQLRIAMEGGEFGTFDFFPKLNQLIWSDKTKELFGLPTNAAANYDTYIAALHPEDRGKSSAIAQQQAHLKEGGLYELEYRIIGITDGKLRWLRSKGKATYNNKGEVIRYTGVIQDVTKQKEAAEIVRENNKRFRDTVKQTPIGICILRGRQFLVEMANNAYLEVVDRKEDEFIGRPLFESLPEVEETVHQLLDDVLTTGIPFHGIEYPVPLNRYGKEEVGYFNFLYHPLKEDDGTISGIIVTCTDVNASVKAKHALAESEKQFKNLIMQSPIALAIFRGKEYIIEMANEVMMNTLWKKSEAEVIGKKLLEVFPELNDQKYPELLNSVLTEGSTHRENESLTYIHNQHGELETFYLDFEYKPLFATDGSISGIIAHVNDVTEKVVARNQIQESETRFRNMVEQAPVAICVLRGENYVVEVANEKQLQVWGKTKEEVLNKPVFIAIPEGAGQGFEQLLASVFTDGKPFIANEFPSTFIRYGQEETSFLNFVYEPLYGHDHKIEGVLSVATEVTEQVIARKLIEESKAVLQESKERLEFILECAKGGDWELDLLTGKAITSFRHDQCFGATAPISDWSYDKFLSYVHPEDRESEDLKFKQAIEKGSDWSIDCRVVWKDGSIHWIQSSARNYLYVAGKPTRMLGMVREVTEQKEAQKKIEESEQRFRLSLSGTNQIVFSQDRNLKHTWIHNPHPDFKAKDIIGKTDEDLHIPSTAAILTGLKQQILHDGIAFNGDIAIEVLGQTLYYTMHLEAVRDAAGNISGLIGTCIDITERIKTQQKIEESEQRFRNVADSAPVLIWMADTDKRCDFFNKGWLNFTGRTMEQERGNGWAEGVHPDDLQKCMDIYLSSFDKREPFYMEYRLKRHDGEYRWLSDSGVPRFTSDGVFEGYIGACMDINDERVHQQALQESEEKFRLLADSMPQHIWTSDPQGNLNYYNQSVFKYSGLTPEQINKDGWIQIVHPDDREENITQWLNAVTTGNDFLFEHRFRRHDGEYRWQLSRAIPQRDETGKIQMWVGTSTDIQDQKTFAYELEEQVGERTKELEASNIELENKTIQLEEAQQLAHIGSWEWDVVANKIEWSDELFRIFGLRPQEFKADYENYLKYIHPDDREYVNSIIQQALRDHLPYSLFHKVACADGKVRILSATGKVITDGSGEVIRMSGTAQDVTEQKNYEKELKISEERFYKIFDSNPVPMSLSEIGNSKIKLANNRFYNAFGYSKEEVIGRSSEELKLLDPEESKRVVTLIFGYLLENRTLAEVQALSKEEKEALLLKLKQSEKMKDFEILYTRKNGEKFPALVSYEIIRMGFDSYTVTSYQDITERKKAEVLLMSQNDQLEKMNKELESFAYISSHDLQEPLRKIQTFASRIAEKEANNLSDSGKYMFNRMQDSAKRMQTLIQDLLAYSRTNANEQKFETTHLDSIIAEVKEDLKEELEEKHATIEATQLGEAAIIPFQFRQLMHNLIGNSLKFSNPANPPHIHIKSEIANGIALNNEKLSPHHTYCHITVSDNGIGFEQQYSEKIFEVFQRLHGKNEYKGTGIGLSIVKKIVENHKGIITANGQLNKGATFEIYIPAT